MIYFARKFKIFLFFVHLDVAATGNAAGTHAARHNGSVRSLTAANGKNTLRVLHAFDVFGGSFKANENHFLLVLAFFHGVFRGEYDAARSRAGGSRNTLADHVGLVRRFKVFRVERRVKKHIQRFRVDLHQGFLFGDHAFVDQIARNLDRGGSRTFTVTGLQHVKFAFFDREFHILHISVMIFQSIAHFEELLVHVGHDFRHLRDRHGRTYAGHNVFALRVHKEFAHKPFFAGSGVTRERNAGAAIVAHVAERHHLNVYGSTPGIRDVVVHTIDVRTGVVPRTEHRFDRFKQLFFRIVGEIFAELLFVFGFKLVRQFFQIVCIKVNVVFHALFRLHLVDQFFKVFLTYFHNDVGEHLNETTVAVPRPTGIVRFRGDNVHHFFVKPEV